MNKIESDDLTDGSIIVNRYTVDPGNNPSLSTVDTVTLKDGKRVRKTARHLVIIDQHTGEVHHHAITIETHKKTSQGLSLVDKHTVTLDGSTDEAKLEDDEIFKLSTFLQTIHYIPNAGTHLVIPTTSSTLDHHSIMQFVNAISTSNKADMLAEILYRIKDEPQVLQAIVKRLSENPEASKEATATLNIARFTTALEDLDKLIDSNALEGEFQSLLSKNEWMFGSEYSTLLDNRRWTRDELQDFMLRRTTDGYLELIEIKTPLNTKPLFLQDPSHATLYPRSELSLVLGQVTHYLEKLDASRHIIRSEDGEDVNKICAKIIIGRDGDTEQTNALRRLNGHLHRIEILTFDQLVRIARRVLNYQQQILSFSELENEF
jgi:hypothetical protein